MENVYKHSHSQKGLYEVDMCRGLFAFKKWTIIETTVFIKYTELAVLDAVNYFPILVGK